MRQSSFAKKGFQISQRIFKVILVPDRVKGDPRNEIMRGIKLSSFNAKIMQKIFTEGTWMTLIHLLVSWIIYHQLIHTFFSGQIRILVGHYAVDKLNLEFVLGFDCIKQTGLVQISDAFIIAMLTSKTPSSISIAFKLIIVKDFICIKLFDFDHDTTGQKTNCKRLIWFFLKILLFFCYSNFESGQNLFLYLATFESLESFKL